MGRVGFLLLLGLLVVGNVKADEVKCMNYLIKETKMKDSDLTKLMLGCGFGATINENALWTNPNLGHETQVSLSEFKDLCITVNRKIKDLMSDQPCQ